MVGRDHQSERNEPRRPESSQRHCAPGKTIIQKSIFNFTKEFLTVFPTQTPKKYPKC